MRILRNRKTLAGLILLAVFVFLAVFGPTLAPYPALQIAGKPWLGPSSAHWFGTTQEGYDVWSQFLSGDRAILVVSFLSGVIATVLSVIIGVAAGYFGGLADNFLSMLANIFLVLPALPFLIVINSYLPAGGKSSTALMAGIISLTGWAWGARVLRSQTLSLRKRDFVDAAGIVGERSWRIITFEIVPNLVPVVASSFLFTTLYAMGTYVALTFVGAVDVNTPWSWGSMLFWAQGDQAAASGAWVWFAAPGVAVALLGTSLALLNFGIDEFINPRLKAAGLTRRGLRAAGVTRRSTLGLTPVLRPTAAVVVTSPAEIIEETV
ncbi:ABC transporter permease [Actinospica sp.]|jgi:peptide/nickel transport system permease protein|uniref:ABC transporter permease n=1 Tax=Actinospica sp. TaxID=1872142 RepID=UPI002C219D63|nr:ABC transporter permease [Actinospica sp.]HWG24629.1 ABC transporter permease [Actinospica sp.]